MPTRDIKSLNNQNPSNSLFSFSSQSGNFLDSVVGRIRQSYFNEVLYNISKIFSDPNLSKSNSAKVELRNSFEKFMRNYFLDKFYYHPLSGGFSLFLMIPPYLSAEKYKKIFGVPFSSPNDEKQKFFHTTLVSLPFIASEFSPPQISAKLDENKLLKGSIPVVEEIWPGNSINVTFYETKELMVYTFHKIWMDYIEEVRMGIVEPDEEIIKNGLLDYAAASFVLRFSPNLDLLYLGYLVGLVPTSRNPGDIIKGHLEYNDVQTVSFNYSFFYYTEFTYFELMLHGYTIEKPNGHPWLEKLNKLFKYYIG